MVTDKQVRRLFMFIKTEKTKAAAAMKAGMDEKTARKYIKLGKLPSEVKIPHTWRTRKDPFESKWPEICNMLEENPGLEAKTVFEYLQRESPGEYDDGQLRTLQRKIKYWRATKGPAREVFFPQKHYPGELCSSDFTHMRSLGITLQGKPFEHLLYHFTLTYSNWETGTICYSESFESLSEGLQNSLWILGGVPKRHRTDRLTVAVNKECNPEKFTRNYKALLQHYRISPERINARCANENGDIEQRHGNLKRVVKQALMLRGSSDFKDICEYKMFLDRIFSQLNSGREKRFQEEIKVLGRLPWGRHDHFKEYKARVGAGSTIHIQHNTYSVHSRLIGEEVKVRVYLDHLAVIYGNKLVEKIPRQRGEGKCRIQYQHIIEWLIRKPGAFENYRYKAELFPSSYYRMVFDYLKENNPLRANKEYLKILYLAFKEGESKVEDILQWLIRRGEGISSERIEKTIKDNDKISIKIQVEIRDVELSAYDELLHFREEAAVHG